MARPKSRQPVDYRSLILPDGMDVEGDLQFKSAEDDKERDHRLRKDWWSFFVSEVLASIVAFSVLLALVMFSFLTLVQTWSTPDDKKFATSLLAAVGTAVAGFVFGRGTK